MSRGLESYDTYSGLTPSDKDRIAVEAYRCGLEVSYGEGGSMKVIGDGYSRMLFRERMSRNSVRADNY